MIIEQVKAILKEKLGNQRTLLGDSEKESWYGNFRS